MSVQDLKYNPQNVDPELRSIFEQLLKEFSSTAYVFQRTGEELGRWMSAGVQNRKTQATVMVRLSEKSGSKKRKTLLDSSELQRIHTHLSSGAGKIVIALFWKRHAC